MKYIIKDNQAGFVIKNGVFVKMITTGTYHFAKIAGYEVEIEEMSGELTYTGIPYHILAKDTVFSNATVHIEIPDGFAGFIYVNGKLSSFALQSEYTFWNVFDKYEIKLVSMTDTVMGTEVSKQMISLIPTDFYTVVRVADGETGIVYYDNIMQKPLLQGIYYFWNHCHSVTYNIIDMKQKEMDIVGQEILTKDKTGIRMNVACMYRIRNAVEFVSSITDLKGQLYPAIQLAVREITGNYKLDELLELKDKISHEIFAVLKEREDIFCVNFLSVGIKDIILPGEIRDIMNSVLLAEKTAQANVIARREEVASTRSLLNTAKLMDENKTLYKLKELEYLERICERVGEISVNGNIGIMEQLGKMIGMCSSDC